MKQVVTIVVKLQPTLEQVAKLEVTLQAFAMACNYVNEHTDPKLTNKIAIQSLTYQTIKNEFNLVANMAVRACARVAVNRKVAKQKDKPVKRFAPTSMDCDKDLFRFREHDWTVSLATIQGRERVELKVGNYQRGKLKGRNPTSAQLCKHRDGQFYLHVQIKDDAPDSPATDKVIGIDLGRRDIAVTSEGEKWDGKHIQQVRDKFSFVRASLQHIAPKGTRTTRRRCREVLNDYSYQKESLVMVSSPSSFETTTRSDRSTELAECGWRTVTVTQPDGTTTRNMVPLTPEEFLHPQEGYRLPNSTFHDDIAGQAKDILTRRYANDPTVGVFRDLLIQWDIPGQGDHCPDTFVALGISNKEQNRCKFIVANEGVRPSFVLEVVSPRYRREDREKKVLQYVRTRVQEYVIIDRRSQREQLVEEVLGYRLVEGLYQPITPDEEGRILCETVGVLMSLQEGCLMIEDANTGERLLSSLELEAANQELEAANQELELAKDSAEKQAAEMAAMLERYRERFGDLLENKES